jgi:hypothetical protein
MTTLVVLMALLAVDQRELDRPPLAEPQIAQIRKLVQATKENEAKLKRLLNVRQQELIAEYAEFEVDEKRILRLQQEIVDLQRQLLVNYHRFQLGLRQATGPEHFNSIKARVDQYVRPEKSGTQSNSAPSQAHERAGKGPATR